MIHTTNLHLDCSLYQKYTFQREANYGFETAEQLIYICMYVYDVYCFLKNPLISRCTKKTFISYQLGIYKLKIEASYT